MLSGRPNTAIGRSIERSQKRTFGTTLLGQFRAFSRPRTRHYGSEASLLRLWRAQVQKVRNLDQAQYRPDDSRDGEQLLVMLDM